MGNSTIEPITFKSLIQMKIPLRFLILSGLLVAGTAWAQPFGDPPSPPDFVPGMPEDLPNLDGFSEETKALREELLAARLALAEERRAFVEEYREANPDATRRDIAQAFATEYADEIAALKDLADQLRDAILEERPEGSQPERPEIPAELDDERAALQEAREALAEAREAYLKAFQEANPDATVEEAKEALRAWHDSEEATALRQDVAEAAKALKDAAEEFRPERPVRQNRPGVNHRRDQFRQAMGEMRDLNDSFHDDMQAATTPEEKKAVAQQYREARQELLDELKDSRRPDRGGPGGTTGGESNRPRD